eukprot:13706766-Ditylum_brightwellii.AAC.1
MGEVVQDETKSRELKSLELAFVHQKKDPSLVVKEKVGKYVNAFLNSAGGVLIFGVNDDGFVERVPIAGKGDDDDDDDGGGGGRRGKCRSMADRVNLARHVKDHIRKLVDGVAKSMDPAVDNDLVSVHFIPVRPSLETSNGGDKMTLDDETKKAQEDEIYNVIEVHVKPRRGTIHFMDANSFDAYERRDGSTFLMNKST